MGQNPARHNKSKSQNCPKSEEFKSETEANDDDDQHKVKLEETAWNVYDSSERDGKYAAVRTNKEK